MTQASKRPTDTLLAPAQIAVDTTTYRRLATMDLPVLRSLIVELRRVSNESAASAVREGTPLAAARANRDAQRASAAEEALASAKGNS
jgi:uncharacterized membrane-anchored protein